MIFGIALTSLTFVALILSITAYYLYYLRKEDSMLKIARWGFYSAVILIFAQAALLMYGILTHHYEWIYVFSYSSNSLSLYYLISTFWAGQEGTFTLWLIYGSIYGLIILKHRKDDEPLVMSFMNLVLAFIVLILIKKNPFEYVWQVNPVGFHTGVIPADGNGLNPLLQDPWMVIHPPILFSGYSSTMILFAFAMSALIRRNYDTWIKSVYPFALFVGLSLGTGLILGGYWAYTTLGWGGYWGWDPVENSSLIPWLISLALIHGIVIQRRQNGMKRLNVFLAISAFVLVLYGSFLTRSGVLTDFSVHSFGESETSTYLLAFVFLFLGIGFITYLYRIREFKGENLTTGFYTRELFMAFGMMLFILLAIFTLIGTSWPILSGIFADKAANIDSSAYNKIGTPLAILMGFLIAMAPLLSWKRSNAQKLKSLLIHLAISLLAAVGYFIAGVKDMLPLSVMFAATLVLLVNGEIVFRMLRRKTYAFGGYLAHVGIGLMLMGVITSSVYDTAHKLTLPLGENVNVYGYNIKYEGKIPAKNGKDRVKLLINDKQVTYAKFYWSEYSRAYMVAPSVVNHFVQDLYISPIQIMKDDQASSGEKIEIKKHETVIRDGYSFTFTGYKMNMHEMGQGNMTIFALIDVMDKNGKSLGQIQPGLKVVDKQTSYMDAVIPGTNRTLTIDGVSVENQLLILRLSPDPAKSGNASHKEMLAAEISIKPFINLLWLGTVLMILGFLTTIYNRTKKQKL